MIISISQGYVFWNQRNAARLLPDMATVDTTSAVTVKTGADGYFEGPIFFKRKGIYYYLYTVNGVRFKGSLARGFSRG